MTARNLGTFPPGSEPWHAARANRIGASEIGVVCGWAPWQTREELLAEKMNPTPKAQTKAMRRGHLLEPAVADWFAEETGATYTDDSNATFVHTQTDWALANPDRLCADGSGLEVKTAGDSSHDHGRPDVWHWGRQGTDQIPFLYLAQCQQSMYVTGCSTWHLAVLFAVHKQERFSFRKYRIRFDPAVAQYLIRQGDAFIAELAQLRQDTAA